MIDDRTLLRPTRNRLLTSMGVSACAIALLLASLGSLFDFGAGVSRPNIEHDDSLTVYIGKSEAEKSPEIATEVRAVRPLPEEQVVSNEFTELRQEDASVDTPHPQSDLKPAKDWRAIARDAAKVNAAENFNQKETRAAMWKKSRSIMFNPADDIVVTDKGPLLANIRFNYRSRVIGLGINLGSCFFGIPVAGVPVEQRSVGISVFVCGQDSG